MNVASDHFILADASGIDVGEGTPDIVAVAPDTQVL